MSLREIAQALKAAIDGLLDYPIPWGTLYIWAAFALLTFFVIRWILRIVAIAIDEVKTWYRARKAMKARRS
jgi:uncharacterized protein HemY